MILEIWIFSKIDHFRPFFEQKWNRDQACFGGNRGVEIDHNAIKNWIHMVLCYKCFEEKHHDCMGKQGLFVCECELCKKDAKAINNVILPKYAESLGKIN